MSIKDIFCPKAWIHSSMNSSGDLRVCCSINLLPFTFLTKEDKSRYNAKMDLFLRNHEYLKILRSYILAGKRHPMCRRCWEIEDAGLLSSRFIWTNHFFPGFEKKAMELTQNDGTIDSKDFPLQSYDLRFGNLCNSKCVICSPENSSMWGEVTDWNHGNLENPYMQELLNNADHITRLYITGGEPMINKSHWKLIDILIENGYSKNITIDYNTNCVLLTKEMIDKWKTFKFISLGFSIDGIGKTFEAIRYPSKWEKVKENLKLFEQCSHENMHGIFAITVYSLNVLNIIDLFKWYYEQKFKKIQVEPNINIVFAPSKFDIRRINQEQKLKIEEEYNKFYKWLDENCDESELIKTIFGGVIKIMKTNPPDYKATYCAKGDQYK